MAHYGREGGQAHRGAAQSFGGREATWESEQGKQRLEGGGGLMFGREG